MWMQLVPIPTTPEYLNASFNLWSPFLPRIAAHSPWSVEQLLIKLARHEVQPVLVFDEKVAVALLGVSIVDDAGVRVAELVWLTGKRRHEWQHLLADLERYLRDHVACKKCRPICRPGWRKFLEANGYTLLRVDADKHIAMEKVL
jgi:hypothetical protein